MAFDARFETLSQHIPEEIRSHLADLTGAAYCPTSRPASVFRLAGERDEDLYLKVLGGLEHRGYLLVSERSLKVSSDVGRPKSRSSLTKDW